MLSTLTRSDAQISMSSCALEIGSVLYTLSGLFSKTIRLVLGAGGSHCLNCDLLDFCDYLDCMWQVAGDESAIPLSLGH